MVAPETVNLGKHALRSAPAAINGAQVAAVGMNQAGFAPTSEAKANREFSQAAKLVLPTAAAITRKDIYHSPEIPSVESIKPDFPGGIGVEPPRTVEENGATNVIGKVGGAGNALMQAEFMLPLAGMALRNTVGQVSLTARQSIGAVTYAPFQALWNVSMKDLLTGNWDKMKGNYYRAFHDYTAGKPYAGKGFLRWFQKGFLGGLDKKLENYPGWESLDKKALEYGVTDIKPLEKATGSMLNRMWHGSAYGVALKGGMIAATAYVGIKAYSSIHHSIQMAQELGEDLYGQHYSAWQIMMNPKTMPPLMQEVRGNMMAHILPEVADVVGQGGQNWAFADGAHAFAGSSIGLNNAGLKQAAMMGGMMISMNAKSLTPSENFLQSYTMLKDTLKAGHKAPMELYGQLIDSASVEARRVGGSTHSRLIRLIAESYAKEPKQLTAVEVLKEIEAKAPFEKRKNEAVAKIKAEDAARKAGAVKPAHDGPIAADAKHEALAHGMAHKEDKEPHGHHHAKYAEHEHKAVEQKADKPSLVVAKQGLMNHGKVETHRAEHKV